MISNLAFRKEMMARPESERKAWLDGIRGVRESRRAIWDSAFGRKELSRLIKEGGVMSRIEDPADAAAIGRRNAIVDLLDDMGLLDEANMERLVGYMLTLPVVPEWVGEEKKNGG